MQQSSKKPAWLLPFLISAAVIAFIILTYAVANYFVHRMDHANSDFFTFWLGGKLLSKGLDPYNSKIWLAGHDLYQATWRPNLTYIYPLPLTIFFVPLSLLELDQAYTLWFFLSIWAVILSVFLMLRMMNSPRVYHLAMPLLAGAFLFRPTIVTLRNGQLGAVLLLVLTLAVYLLQKEHWLSGGLVVALLILKPQLGAPLLVLLLLVLLYQRRWQVPIGMGITGIILLLAGLLIRLDWPIAFLSAGFQKFYSTFGYSPTLWGVVGDFCEHGYTCTLLYGSIGSVLFTLFLFGLLLKYKVGAPIFSVSILILAALLITPYTWAYDQILLVIPISFAAIKLFKQRVPYLISALLFLVIDIAALAFLVLALKTDVDVWSAVIPFACLICVCLPGFLSQKPVLPHPPDLKIPTN
jgi:hypothetical protein